MGARRSCNAEVVAASPSTLSSDHDMPCCMAPMLQHAGGNELEAHGLHHTTSYRVREAISDSTVPAKQYTHTKDAVESNAGVALLPDLHLQ